MSAWIVSGSKTHQRATLGSPGTACANDAWVTQQSLTIPPAGMQIQHAIELRWSTSGRYFLLSVHQLISSRLLMISTSFSHPTVSAQKRLHRNVVQPAKTLKHK